MKSAKSNTGPKLKKSLNKSPKLSVKPTQKTISPEVQQAIDDSTNRTRGALFAIGLALALGAYSTIQKDEKPEAASSIATSKPIHESKNRVPKPTEKKEEVVENDIKSEAELVEMDQRIEKLESSFLAFADIITKAATSLKNEKLKLELAVPAETVKANHSKLKNIARFKNDMAKNNNNVAVIPDNNPESFFYAFERLPSNVGAAYSDMSRIISLNDKFDHTNPVELTFVYHELIHAKLDLERSVKMKNGQMPEYSKSKALPMMSPVPIVFLPDEVHAHKITLEALNLYFGGELEKLGSDATTSFVQKLFLNKSAKDNLMTELFSSMIAAQTKAHFGKDKDEKNKEIDFRKIITRIHGDYAKYKITPTGGYERLSQEE